MIQKRSEELISDQPSLLRSNSIKSTRYHLSSSVQSWSEMEDARERLALLHALLEELSFEGCRQKERVVTKEENPIRGGFSPEDEVWDMEFMMEMPEDDVLDMY